MQRLVTAFWFLHVVALGLWSALLFFVPNLWLGQAETLPLAGVAVFTSVLQANAGLFFALAVMAGYGAMREDPRARRRIARALAVGLGGFALLGHFLPPEGLALDTLHALPHLHVRHLPRDTILLQVLGALGFLNLLIALLPAGGRQRQLSGRADTKPLSLWMLWTGQALLLGLLGLLLMLFGRALLDFGLAHRDSFDVQPGAVMTLHTQQNLELFAWAAEWTQRAGALWLALGVLSVAGNPEPNEPEWRGFCFVHVLWTLVATICLAMASSAAMFDLWVLLLPLSLTVIFGLANLKVVAGKRVTPSEEVGDPPDGWTFMDLVAGPIVALRVLLGKRRGTHSFGVAAKGIWEPAPYDPRIPPHPWFFPEKQRESPVKVFARFANVTFSDDAGMDVRGAAIRLAPPDETPVDVLMNTGSCGPIANVLEFGMLVFSKALPHALVVKAVKKNRVGREGGVAGLRRAPESYALLHYYSQSTRYWLASDDARWLVRYRLLPADLTQPETGLPTEADDLVTWERDRHPGETRPRDYCRRELKQRLDHEHVRLRFQAQFHRPGVGDDLSWYNGLYDWPPAQHPWLELGQLVLTTALSDADAELLTFDPSVHPPSLGVPVALSPLDPRSPADSERRVIARTAKLRLWLYETLGLPAFGADEGN